MKRIILLLLILSCLFGMIGCTQVPRPAQAEVNYNERPLTVVGAHSEVEVLSIQADGLCTYPDLPDEWYLSVNWNNETEQYVQCTEIEYWIERLDNGQWISCAVKDDTVTASDYELRPYGSVKSYEITDRFDMSAAGTYRFVANCDVSIGDITYTDVALWTEFTIA